MELIFLWVFPLYALFITLIFCIFIFFMPASAKKLYALRIKTGKTLGIIADDDGSVNFELLESMGAGVFKSDVGKRVYRFLLRPLFAGATTLDKIKIDGANYDLESDEKAKVDEILLKKHVISDIRKPALIGYRGKLILTGPSTLNEVEKASKLDAVAIELGISTDEVKKLIKSAESKKAKDKKDNYADYFLNCLDPRIWKNYIKKTSNQAGIDALCYTHEQIGAGDKPKINWGLIILLLIVVIAIIFLLKYMKVI